MEILNVQNLELQVFAPEFNGNCSRKRPRYACEKVTGNLFNISVKKNPTQLNWRITFTEMVIYITLYIRGMSRPRVPVVAGTDNTERQKMVDTDRPYDCCHSECPE